MSSQSSVKTVFFDIDGTLYDKSANIETQIGDRIRSFMRLRAGISDEMSEKWWMTHGSTIEGYLDESPHRVSVDMIRDYYTEIFDDSIDYSGLVRLHTLSASGDSTGYQHDSKMVSLKSTLQAIHDLTNRGLMDTYVASNSPSAHVKRVLNLLGLGSLKYKKLLSPDTVPKRALHSSINQGLSVPSSKTRSEYWSDIRKDVNLQDSFLLDDSQGNLRFASNVLGMKTIHVNSSNNSPLPFALARLFNTVPDQKTWKFRDVDYLTDKNIVDDKSMNPQVWNKLKEKLHNRIRNADRSVCYVADIGAGVLGMLPKVTELAQYVGHSELGKEKMKFVYVAFESNQDLTSTSVNKLLAAQFHHANEVCDDGCHDSLTNELIANHFVKFVNGVEIHVYLAPLDFRSTTSKDILKIVAQQSDHATETPVSAFDLLIGACFADLFKPDDLVSSLIKFSGQEGTLLYFPITFDGHTCFDPPVSIVNEIDGKWTMPVDQEVTDAYHDSLANIHSHNLDSNKLVQTIRKFGGKEIASGRSDWLVKKSSNPYFWESLVYFIGLGTTPILAPNAYNIEKFFNNLRSQVPDIRVRNYDILAALPNAKSDNLEMRGGMSPSNQVKYVEFVGPGRIIGRSEPIDSSFNLIGSQIEIESDYSMISSGTELKFFKGEFEKDSPLDLNIGVFKESKSVSYPFRYGYSLCGRVTKVGPDLKAEDWLGKRVFAFHNHASKAVINASDAFLVPDFVSSADSVFLPAVETALSLVHEANPRVGDNVAVIGQGLIGLLVSAILERFHQTGNGMKIGGLTVFDTNPLRLDLAKKIAPSCRAVNPLHFSSMKGDKQPAGNGFDIVIELSGSPKGIQVALDNVGYGGKVILGSWYGNLPVPLSLDLPFHRNHIHLVTSQVSRVSGELSDRWSKFRRFELAWKMLSVLQPAERLRPQFVAVDDCQAAYNALENGKEAIVLFDYSI